MHLISIEKNLSYIWYFNLIIVYIFTNKSFFMREELRLQSNIECNSVFSRGDWGEGWDWGAIYCNKRLNGKNMMVLIILYMN